MFKRSARYGLVILLTFSLLNVSTAFASRDKTFFWKVSSAKTSVYLLGSIHFADDSFYPLRRAIESAFESADKLVVELDITRIDPSEYIAFIDEYGNYADDETIKDHLSASSYARLLAILKQMKIPLSLVETRKPGFIAMELAGALLAKMGYQASKGIDINLMRRAVASNKNIIELETLQQQLQLFAEVPGGEDYIKATLDNISHAEDEINRLMQAWKQGDDDELLRLMVEEPEALYPDYNQINDAILYQRNDAMTQKIKRFLDTDESYFVVVGAAHLVGERGIVKKLVDAGYTVQRL